MARVAIPRAVLKRHRACDGAYTSPEWDTKEDALVYSDFDKSAARLMSTEDGTDQLEWLVSHKLVPMTMSEFTAAKKNKPQADFSPLMRGFNLKAGPK